MEIIRGPMTPMYEKLWDIIQATTSDIPPHLAAPAHADGNIVVVSPNVAVYIVNGYSRWVHICHPREMYSRLVKRPPSHHPRVIEDNNKFWVKNRLRYNSCTFIKCNCKYALTKAEQRMMTLGLLGLKR